MEGTTWLSAMPSPSVRRDRRHLARVRTALPPSKGGRTRGRRGPSAQRARREREECVRQAVLALLRWMIVRRGRTLEDVAHRLWLRPRTLRRWLADWRARKRAAKPRGRPASTVTREQRQTVRAVLALTGLAVSIRTLRLLFPDLTRAVLVDLKRRLRRALRRRSWVSASVLCWTKAGAVWAMDFAEPPTPIDGEYGYVLLVRDLASGFQLLTLPGPAPTSPVVVDALEALFAAHGAPLVIKMDNGAAFIARETQAFLDRHHVMALISPPYLPSYNGSIEAGVGSFKTRAHHEAARNGRPGEWTCDDAEAARLQANDLSRPRGQKGPTPDEAWAAREPIDDKERLEFLVRTAEHWLDEYGTLGLLPGIKPDRKTHNSIQRTAIVRALIDRRLLEIGRSRITPLYLRMKTARIT